MSFLAGVAEAREAEIETVGAESLERGANCLRATDRHDLDALGGEIPSAAPGERRDGTLVADALDEHDGTVESAFETRFRCRNHGVGSTGRAVVPR
jgi:hypothetical protein